LGKKLKWFHWPEGGQVKQNQKDYSNNPVSIFQHFVAGLGQERSSDGREVSFNGRENSG
jgi:hypothetical protein